MLNLDFPTQPFHAAIRGAQIPTVHYIYVSDMRGRLSISCSFVFIVGLCHTVTLVYSSFRWKAIRMFNALPMHIRNITACMAPFSLQ